MSSTRHLTIGASGPTFRTTSRHAAQFRWSDRAGALRRHGARQVQHRLRRRRPPCRGPGRAHAQRYGSSPTTARTARSPPEISATRNSVDLPDGSPACCARSGINKGDRVFTIMGRVPELYIAMLGALRNGSIVSPLFSAFGPEPIATRVDIGQADVLVTTRAIYQRKIAKIRDRLPSVRHILIVDDDEAKPATSCPERSTSGIAWTQPTRTRRSSPPPLTTRRCCTSPAVPPAHPKGAIHVHGAVTMHYVTGLYALDLHPDDIYWCTADPGWVTGTSYGIISPLLHGVTSIVDEAEFDAERWYSDSAGSGRVGVVHRADRDHGC